MNLYNLRSPFNFQITALVLWFLLLNVEAFGQQNDSTILTHISDQYDKKSHWLIGGNYRDVWKTDIEIPVFDIGKVKGGLTILKQGGGQQTRSLRMEAKDGKQYVIRSIEKYTIKAVPELLRTTVAADLIQDQMSASHPYGAFVVPLLAEAAGVYHTNPKVVYIPDDPRLGQYRELFANSVCLFEERVAKDWSDQASFGNSKKIISTPDMLEDLYEDNDNRVDQLWVLKSRLFDMFIADWDRHDDQWRWARFENKGPGHYYQPIPRDRDQAFFVSEGFLMGIISRKWAMPKFQGFGYDFKFVSGFNFNARHFDRDFLNEPSLEQWLAAADTLKQRLTDEVIENAIHKWPEAIFAHRGKEVIAKLKSQRDNLNRYAREHYLFLAKEVDVVGSDKKEFFEVDRIDDEQTDVKVYKKTKDDSHEKLIYHRIFKTSETKELRLYGLGGKDDFRIKGEVNKGPLVRVIGGYGKDEIKDKSKVKGWKKKNIIYDSTDGNDIEPSKETRAKLSADTLVNYYNRKAFKYKLMAPIIMISSNKDDGLFIGGGFINHNQGFRKDPYKSSHTFTGKFAFATNAFSFRYKALFPDVVRKSDFGINIVALAPNYVTNYFGLGNESVYDKGITSTKNIENSIDYHRTRYEEYRFEITLSNDMTDKLNFTFGHELQTFEIEKDYGGEDRLVLDNALTTGDNSIFNRRTYEGMFGKLIIDTRDSTLFSSKGILLDLEMRGYVGLLGGSQQYTKFSGQFSGFVPLNNRSTAVLAARVGAGYNSGDYEFYQAQVLDGTTNLRGYRKTRFYGDAMLYNNVEVRTKLFNFNNRIAPMTIGINVFNDVGRVWLNGENSDKWHHGYGAGIWLAPINIMILSIEVARSEEDFLGYFNLGFRF